MKNLSLQNPLQMNQLQTNHASVDGPSIDSLVTPIPHLYDIATDVDRPVTQADVDRMQRTMRAFGELAKRLKFNIAEVRNGLVQPGQAIDEIEQSLKVAENIAASLNLDQMLHDGVHGKHVLVVER